MNHITNPRDFIYYLNESRARQSKMQSNALHVRHHARYGFGHDFDPWPHMSQPDLVKTNGYFSYHLVHISPENSKPTTWEDIIGETDDQKKT